MKHLIIAKWNEGVDKKAMLAQKPEVLLGYAAEIAPAIMLANMAR